MAQPEQKVVDGVRKVIAKHGGHSFKTHGNMYQAGQPDVIGCIRGRMICVECKDPAKKGTKAGTPTPLQQATLDKWAAAGALALACHDPAELEQQLKEGGL